MSEGHYPGRKEKRHGPSRYTLSIHNSRVEPDILLFRGREALGEPLTWHIEFTTSQRDLAGQDILLKYASLEMRNGKVVHGIITRFSWLGTSADRTHYSVCLAFCLVLLSLTRRCAIYQNVSVPELVEQLLRRHGLEGPDFVFRPERHYPLRELITQWRETDLAFIQRILSEVGIWFRSVMRPVTEQETLIFADSQLKYHFGLWRCLIANRLYDSAAESCWQVRTWCNPVTGRVTLRHDNYRTDAHLLSSSVIVRNDAVTLGEKVEHNILMNIKYHPETHQPIMSPMFKIVPDTWWTKQQIISNGLIKGATPYPRHATEALQAWLNLRFDPAFIIMTAVDYGLPNLPQLQAAGYNINGLNDAGKAKIFYLTHHPGIGDAKRFINKSITEESARRLLIAQIGKKKAASYANVKEKNGSYWKAHRAWLSNYIDNCIDVKIFTAKMFYILLYTNPMS